MVLFTEINFNDAYEEYYINNYMLTINLQNKLYVAICMQKFGISWIMGKAFCWITQKLKILYQHKRR